MYRFPRVEIPRHLVERAEVDLLTVALARRERAHQWRDLFAEVRVLVAYGCPFPIHLYRESDYCRFVVRAGGVRLAVIDDEQLRRLHHPGLVGMWIAQLASAGYAALEHLPVPPNVTLGDN